MEMKQFPNKLRTYRLCSGHSQKKVARMLGLPHTTMLSRWERGVGLPSIMQVFRLARIYGIKPHELYDELWHRIDEELSLLAQHDEPIISNQELYV